MELKIPGTVLLATAFLISCSNLPETPKTVLRSAERFREIRDACNKHYSEEGALCEGYHLMETFIDATDSMLANLFEHSVVPPGESSWKLVSPLSGKVLTRDETIRLLGNPDEIKKNPAGSQYTEEFEYRATCGPSSFVFRVFLSNDVARKAALSSLNRPLPRYSTVSEPCS